MIAPSYQSPLGIKPPRSIPTNSAEKGKGKDFCGFEGLGHSPSGREQSLKKINPPFRPENSVQYRRHDRPASHLLRLPAMAFCPRIIGAGQSEIGAMPGKGPLSDRDRRWPSHSLAHSLRKRMVRAASRSLIALALLAAPQYHFSGVPKMVPPAYAAGPADPIDAKARDLAVLCDRMIDAELAMQGGGKIIFDLWIEKAKPSREEFGIQVAFCARYFDAYDQAKEKETRR